jgi:hypothetical protein
MYQFREYRSLFGRFAQFVAAAFVQRLRELGWIEGRTIAMEYRWSEGNPARQAEFFASGPPAAAAAKRAMQHVSRAFARSHLDETIKEATRAFIGHEHVPISVHHQCRKRFVLPQDAPLRVWKLFPMSLCAPRACPSPAAA